MLVLNSNLKNLNQNVILVVTAIVFMLTKVVGQGSNTNGCHQNPSPCNDAGHIVANKIEPIQEYFIEHQVNQRDAAKSFRVDGVKLLSEKPIPSWCAIRHLACTPRVMQYCLGGQMLHDHCCCDSRHGREELPWIPHSCYVGESCRPNIGSCVDYAELRECCCDRALAKEWKGILSHGAKPAVNCMATVTAIALLHKILFG